MTAFASENLNRGQTDHRLLFLGAVVLSLLFFAASSYANINDYNLSCVYEDLNSPTQILINTYSLNVGFTDNITSTTVTDFETLLVQPVEECQHCYDLTVATQATHKHIYLVHLRAEKPGTNACTYNVAVDEATSGEEYQPIIPQIACKKINLPKKKTGKKL